MTKLAKRTAIAMAIAAAWVCGATAYAASGSTDVMTYHPAFGTTGSLTSSDEVTNVQSDQPNFVPSTTTVDHGVMQVETGVQRLSDRPSTEPTMYRVWTTPTTMRLGLQNGIEFRLQSNAASRVHTFTTATNGFSDVTLGFKGTVASSADPRLSSAWMIDLALPTGSQALRTPGVRPAAAVTMAWAFPNHTSVGGVAGVRMDEDVTHARFANGMAGVNVTHDWSSKLHTFGELDARSITSSTRGGKVMMWNVGGGYCPVPELQLQGAMGFGLMQNDPDLAWTVGVSRRFTPHMPGALSHRQKKNDKNDTPPSASTESTDGK